MQNAEHTNENEATLYCNLTKLLKKKNWMNINQYKDYKEK